MDTITILAFFSIAIPMSTVLAKRIATALNLN